MFKSQVKSGVTPKLRDQDLLDNMELQLLMESGVTVTLDDLSYKEAEILKMIQNTKNKVVNKEMNKSWQQ